MVLYTCPRCGFTNKIKTKMRNHFNRKIPCKTLINDVSIKNCIKYLDNEYTSPNKTGEHICKNCGKFFERKYNYDRHISNCKLVENSSDQKLNDVKYSENDKDLIIKTKDMIIENLKSQIEILLKNQGNNNTHNNITYNTQIILNPFGKEDTSYITGDYVRKLIDNGPVNSVAKLLEHIHFNPNHKENHNITIPNKKLPWAKIYNGVDWELHDKKQTLVEMTDKAYSILNKHYNGGNQYMCKFKEQYETNDGTLSKRLNKDTEKMILNLQQII